LVCLGKKSREEEKTIFMNYKNISGFFSIFLITYIILLLPAGPGKAYGNFLRNIANKTLNGINKDELILLKENSSKEKAGDTRLYLSNKALKVSDTDYTTAIYPLKLKRIGFIATAFLISLIIAAPVSWRRKLTALLIGFSIMTIFVLIKLRIIILHTYAISQSIGLHQDPEEIKRITFWDEIFGTLNTNGYYMAILIWLVVTFRKNDWQRLHGIIKTYSKDASSQKHPKANTVTKQRTKR
jgi:hypothetical protein